jgi:hypothetical protein
MHHIMCMLHDFNSQAQYKSKTITIDDTITIKALDWVKRLESEADKIRLQPWRFKRPALYLVGPPNTGKTTVCRSYFAKYGLRVFEPSASVAFPFDAFTTCDDYDVVFWDDYRWRDEQERMILTLLQGDHCNVDRKHRGPLELKWRKLTILTSNLPAQNNALKARVLEILCDENCVEIKNSD